MASSMSMINLASILELTEPFQPESLFQEKDVFIAGLDDTNIFRIPVLLATPDDTLLAFCEARERDDIDPTDLVLKRSVKGEKNLQGVNGVVWQNDRKWSPMQVVLPGNGGAICNPCALVDHSDGTIWLCCMRAFGGLVDNLETTHGELLLLRSADNGATWSEPIEIGPQVGYFLPGPGVGTCLHNGRLIIPGYNQDSSRVIYSDDRGRTWRAGAPVAYGGASESQAVELQDGTLLLDMRISGRRHVALSRDGGETWFEEYDAEALPDPSCMAAIVRYSGGSDGGTSRLLFANAASPRSRIQMTVRLSYDEGRSWSVAKLIHPGPAAYSSLATLADGTIGLLYETGDSHPYERIRFARFSLEWLTDGRDRARPTSLPMMLPLEWEFTTDPGDTGIRDEWFKTKTVATWHGIRVDAPWTQQGHDYHGVAWYRTRFIVPTDLRKGSRRSLLFGAVDGLADVYLDGTKIGEQTLSPRIMRRRPFFASLPEMVAPGQTCDLMVRVVKDADDAGLCRPVCLVEIG